MQPPSFDYRVFQTLEVLLEITDNGWEHVTFEGA
jgi:hypothetical protein